MNLRLTPLICLIVFLAIQTSCKKNDGKPSWESQLLVPLISDDLGFEDLLEDSLLEADAEGLLHLVVRENLYDYSLVDESISVPDTSLEVFVSLETLVLNDRSITTELSLGQILLSVPGGSILVGLISLGFPVEIPEIVDLSTGVVPIDATSFFQSAEIDSGFLDIEVYNGLPVDLTNAVFRLSDPAGGFDIIQDTFDLIPAGGTVMSVADLEGLSLNGLLEAELIKVSTPGSGVEIVVDTSDAIVIQASVRDIRVLEATAIFPTQNLVETAEDIEYELGGPRITSMKIKEGQVKIFVVNTIQEEMQIEYRIPGAISSDGLAVSIETVVPAAPPGGNSIVDEEFDLAGYFVDLSGQDGNGFNTFYNEFVARIDSSGNVVTISLEDSLQVIYGLEGIVPAEIRGYAGKSEVSIDESQSFDFLKGVSASFLDLESLDVTMNIENGIGVQSVILLSELGTTNSGTSASAMLSAPGVVGSPIQINRALNNPFIPGITTIKLDAVSSNVDELLEILPDQLTIRGDISINPNGNDFGYQDFVLEGKGLSVNLDVDLPLSFEAEDLFLSDTFDFAFLTDEEAVLDVRSGILNLKIQNGFPLDAEVQINFTDGGISALRLWDTPFEVAAGVQGSDCRVALPSDQFIEIALSEEEINILRETEEAIITVSFNTTSSADCEGYVKIYSDYRFKFTLTADIELDITADF